MTKSLKQLCSSGQVELLAICRDSAACSRSTRETGTCQKNFGCFFKSFKRGHISIRIMVYATPAHVTEKIGRSDKWSMTDWPELGRTGWCQRFWDRYIDAGENLFWNWFVTISTYTCRKTHQFFCKITRMLIKNNEGYSILKIIELWVMSMFYLPLSHFKMKSCSLSS